MGKMMTGYWKTGENCFRYGREEKLKRFIPLLVPATAAAATIIVLLPEEETFAEFK